MRTTEENLFELISNVVFGKKLSFDSLSKDEIFEIYKIAKKHNILHIISAALIGNGLVNDEKAAVFKENLNTAVFKGLSMQYAFDRCCELLEKEHIDYIPLKGAVLRPLYPEAWMRVSVDIDILVKPEDHQRTADILVDKLGLRRTEISTPHDITLRADDDTCVELHFDLIEESIFPKVNGILSDVWSMAEPCAGSSHKYKLPMNIVYFYHVAHLAKHMKLGGGGIKDFLDLHLLCLSGQETKTCSELLEKGGIFPFAKAAEGLCKVWFAGEEHTELTKSLSEFVMSGGLFRSHKNSSILDIKQNHGKLGYYLSRVFVPYDYLKKQYPVIEKHPYLTPVYGIVRLWSLAFGRKKQTRKDMVSHHSKISKEDVNKTKKLLNELKI